MTAWIYLGLVLLSGLCMALSYNKGAEDATNRLLAVRAVTLEQANKDKEEMLNAVAEAIKEIDVEQRTIVQKFRTIEKENVVYRECKHSDDVVRLLNSTLRGDPVPSQPALQDSMPGGSR